MEIWLGERKHDPDLRLLLSDPRRVEELLREIREPCLEWLDFSIAVLEDDPFAREVLAPCEGCVLWKLQTYDGVPAHVFVALELEQGLIRVDYRLEESEDATLWRHFKPIVDAKLATFGIDTSGARNIEEYLDLLPENPEDQPARD
jgi:hypothetical protein